MIVNNIKTLTKPYPLGKSTKVSIWTSGSVFVVDSIFDPLNTKTIKNLVLNLLKNVNNVVISLAPNTMTRKTSQPPYYAALQHYT